MTGTEELVFLEVFPIGTYQEISASEWLVHTPARLVDQHIKTGEDFLNKIPKQEAVVTTIQRGPRLAGFRFGPNEPIKSVVPHLRRSDPLQIRFPSPSGLG
jgi:hypothetical protein